MINGIHSLQMDHTIVDTYDKYRFFNRTDNCLFACGKVDGLCPPHIVFTLKEVEVFFLRFVLFGQSGYDFFDLLILV